MTPSIFEGTTTDQRREMFNAFSALFSNSYRTYIDEISRILEKDVFEIVDFNELKAMRDKIANDGQIGTHKDTQAWYGTSIQTYMQMLYALKTLGEDHVMDYKKKDWPRFIKELHAEGLLIDAENITPLYRRSHMRDLSESSAQAIPTTSTIIPTVTSAFDIDKVCKLIASTGLIYDDKLVKRYAASLLTKPFVILSGLAGSGKTQLSLAFAHVLCENIDEQLCFAAVGADWTNREPLLGYPNALKNDEYIKPENGVLDIILRAETNPTKPYFLVLDEMNLSYVERYFADFLSAMESDSNIALWSNNTDVPASVCLPNNLFITGTINVDETTYMFSPKVLDRANVIEFKVSNEDMDMFLDEARTIDKHAADSKASDMAAEFVKLASNRTIIRDEDTKKHLLEFFKVLKEVNAEFGYRSASEIYRFIGHAKDLGLTAEEAIDAAIVQKLLPKLHGSRKRVMPVLRQLWLLCQEGADKIEIEAEEAKDANIVFSLSADKIFRMRNAAIDNGFTSFAEA